MQRVIEAIPSLPRGRWLEPSAGDGAIMRAVNSCRRPHYWTAVELREECRAPLRAIGADVTIADFIALAPAWARTGTGFSVAILNPPFSLSLQFIAACLPIAEHTVALLRLNWLEGQERNGFLRDHAPDVYVLPVRPSFTGGGTDATAYAWFHWQRGARRSHGRIEVLSVAPAAQLSLLGGT